MTGMCLPRLLVADFYSLTPSHRGSGITSALFCSLKMKLVEISVSL